MKQTLIAVLLLAAIAGQGQTPQTTAYPITGCIPIGERRPQPDTINVLFLVSDTSRTYYVTVGFKFDEKQDTTKIYLTGKEITDTVWGSPGERVFWVFGHIARVRQETWAGDYWEPVAYLDANKRPMASKLVIWTTMNCK